MTDNKIIRDLIYFDFDKAASIASQLEGGLMKEIQSSLTESREVGGGIDVQLANLGGNALNTQTKLVTKALHHDLFVRVEKSLFDLGLASDINESFHESEFEIDEIHQFSQDYAYIRATGYVRLHNYTKMQAYLDAFKGMADLVNTSVRHQVEQTPEFKALYAELDKAKEKIEKARDRNKKATAKRKLKQLEDELQVALEDNIGSNVVQDIEDWMLDGIKDLVDILMPKRINLILQPFEELHKFHMLANLKEDCFVDADLDHVTFTYGSSPNVKLTIFGLVTSIPPKGQESKIFLELQTGQVNASQILEPAFNQIFDGTIELENIGRFSRYPNVTLHPIAVYRLIQSSN